LTLSDERGTEGSANAARTHPTTPGRRTASSGVSRTEGDRPAGGMTVDPAPAGAATAARRAAAVELPDRIAFLGFGLIGGSIAGALRDAGCRSQLVGWTPEGRGPAAGLQVGFLDAAATTPADAIDGAGLVVLAGPPLAIVAQLSELAGPLRRALLDGATITDVASTKGRIVDKAGAHRLPFVGGHPMAGREVSGVAGAKPDLFVGRPWVVVPSSAASAQDIARVESLAAAVGARPVRMSAAEHDSAVAAISHLPLVAAAAMVEAVALTDPGAADWTVARALAASGWSDMTRLARGDSEMGAGILATNGPAVVARLRAYRVAIDAWIDLVENGERRDEPPGWGLQGRLEAAKAALEAPES
jgi:prephenate dehydrogenase